MRSSRGRFFVAVVPTLAVAGVVAVAALAGSSAQQGFPGKNGRIVFNDQNGSLVLVNADGTGAGAAGRTRAADQLIGASWSPTGS